MLLGQGFDVDAITPQMIELAQPENFQYSLIGSGVIVNKAQKGKYGVYYTNEEGHLEKVALTGYERKIYQDNVRAIGGAVFKSVDMSVAHQLAPDIDPEAALRAIDHMLSPAAAAMRLYATDTIGTNLRLIAQFDEALQHPNLARFGGEFNIRLGGANLEQSIIETMLDVLHDQRDWTQKKHTAAHRTILANMFIFRKGDKNIDYTRRLLEVNKKRLLATRDAFLGRAAAADAYVTENTPPSQGNAETTVQ